MSLGKNVLDRTNKSTENKSNYQKDKNHRESANIFAAWAPCNVYLSLTTPAKPLHKK